ncbi:MAG: hypothetical protein EA382_09340 [Spirochaetaceae bacterium]|nr:MAG: hypothetical protein EA382_09340 [Spirochaetaceae bacterium]
MFPTWSIEQMLETATALGLRKSPMLFASTAEPSVAPQDGDAESCAPGRRARADRRPGLLFINDSIAIAQSYRGGWVHVDVRPLPV